ncbi:hypothetical protein PoB_006681100 [Plakobranchus ocellatus]|uniref:Uncharacterized protein n=1 Tax=Plakobranchus ocellatus TaxID=259542 RepID=A0AAV4D8P0_9GAST|nr:hypothetical protein PoB_006681100 [Plakobranchus ocellatus]
MPAPLSLLPHLGVEWVDEIIRGQTKKVGRAGREVEGMDGVLRDDLGAGKDCWLVSETFYLKTDRNSHYLNLLEGKTSQFEMCPKRASEHFLCSVTALPSFTIPGTIFTPSAHHLDVCSL